ncbi:4a-hydroxytetrahydrobiopterin dehydratase [Oceanobacillus halotolerans]|uniref:4a-hydroxytetrahydrobiopterin dehydratase n=1 Tax=Oceanobacillus halotolerans TaxID=2663380 RepID=UPI0013D6D62F|nr:4a-hydroxytetrahydrobiopterin dehydratase [Oceanobacillus halotolerans]
MRRLTESEISEALEKVPKWERLDEKWIQRRYRFKEFLTGIQFVDQLAAYAEEKQHHPFMSIDYKVVTVKISSWQAKGLTDLDFEMVQHFEELYEKVNQT